MITLALLAVLAAPSNTWTVDDDGPADFTQIAEAIFEVPAGDVLLVEPGEYTAFFLDKRMTVLGRPGSPRPHVTGQSAVSASSFTVAGLDFNALSVSGVSGRGRIDDCRIGHAGDAGKQWALDIDGCAELVVSRTEVKGSHAYSYYFAGGAAGRIRTSNATLVRCTLKGAKGHDAESSFESGGPGGAGLTVSDGSRVVVVATSILGGDEGYGFLFNCVDGPSGTGLSVSTQSLVVLRGAPGAAGGLVAPGQADFLCGQVFGWSMLVNDATVVTSGVTFDVTNVKVMGSLIQPANPEPLLLVDGPDAPGAHKEIQLHGLNHAPCVLVGSLFPAYTPVGQFDDKLWVGLSGPFALVPLITTGQVQPLVFGFHVPASLAGLEGVSIELQAFFPGLASAYAPGKSIAGNVAEIILRF